MSSLKILEIAGSIGLVSGVTLTIFFFLFNSIIQNNIIGLSKTSLRKTLALMLFVVWSVTITSVTLWVYHSFSTDGGEQPVIKEIEMAEEPAAELSKTDVVAQMAIHSSIINTPAVKLVKNETFFKVENIDRDDICGLKVRSSIWLSFNKSQPYYVAFQDKKIKVILKDIDKEKDKATFVMHLREQGKVMKLHHFTLGKNDFYNFKYNGCDYRFYYQGKTTTTTGIKYWFQNRYSGHFLIEPTDS